uniref:Heme NO-binding domain-containing protein n=1 Tax=Knipowitschia caucasica TaxID=637954 RepID=A0AAV2LEI5_KNICA
MVSPLLLTRCSSRGKENNTEYGFINSCLQSLVEERFGHETWNTISSLAGLQDPFMTYTVYDDAVTLRLVQEACGMLGVESDVLLRLFGEHFFSFCKRAGYDTMLRTLGGDLLEFIQNLDALHCYLALSYQASGDHGDEDGDMYFGTYNLTGKVLYTIRPKYGRPPRSCSAPALPRGSVWDRGERRSFCNAFPLPIMVFDASSRDYASSRCRTGGRTEKESRPLASDSRSAPRPPFSHARPSCSLSRHTVEKMKVLTPPHPPSPRSPPLTPRPPLVSDSAAHALMAEGEHARGGGGGRMYTSEEGRGPVHIWHSNDTVQALELKAVPKQRSPYRDSNTSFNT